MSILLESDLGWIISHEKFFDNIQAKKTHHHHDQSTSTYKTFKLNPTLFQITAPFKNAVSCSKHKRVQELDPTKLSEAAKLVKGLHESIMKLQMANPIFKNEDDHDLSEEKISKVKEGENSWPRSNMEAIKASEEFFQNVKDIKFPEFYGANPFPDYSVISGVNGLGEDHKFIFPPMSSFHCKDVSSMTKVFEDDGDKFDLILMDPPWWNKFIRRKKRSQSEAGYQMIDNDGLKKLPIKTILKEDGIVVVWCTNSRSHHEAVLDFFQSWNVHMHHKLFWLKVTRTGLPVCPFNEENKKQPFETIFIAGKEIPNDLSNEPRLIISVPSSINSHKPPLIDVLKRLYPSKVFDRKLEIFARYLLPGFTSFGNEVIKLQHLSLYVE